MIKFNHSYLFKLLDRILSGDLKQVYSSIWLKQAQFILMQSPSNILLYVKTIIELIVEIRIKSIQYSTSNIRLSHE
jgi:hypothetical protein